MRLLNKKILIGVTAGIAAYKVAFLIRLLIKQGAQVKVLQTPDSIAFIPPVTLATLSKNEVISEFYHPVTGAWNNHVELGMWADAFIIAPATANTIAKMANGICDNILLASYLSSRCPVFFAPAMDLDMYKHKAVQNNINTLQSFGNILIDAGEGELASGLEGKGRMAEPEQILETLLAHFEPK